MLDLTCFTGRRHTLDSALSWAGCLIFNEPRFKSLVLISMVREDVNVVAEADTELFRNARRVFAESGVRLIDWIKTNRKDFRTMTISCGEEVDDSGRSGTIGIEDSEV